MKRFVLLLAVAILFLRVNSFAVSGIGVCDYNVAGEGVDGILANIIKDNVWVDSFFLITVNGRLNARSSQINSHGTHCAFLLNDGGWHVAVTTIGGINKTIKKVCAVPNPGDFGAGRIWTALLEWPRGDWVWFTNSKENNEIYRANVQTGDVQHMASVSVSSNQFQMPGNAKVAIGAYGSDARLIYLPDPSSANLPVSITQTHSWGGACGHGISPSGIYALANNNGYHSRVAISKVDTNTWDIEQDQSVGEDGNVGEIWMGGDSMWYMWDDWALDSSMMCYRTNDEGIPVNDSTLLQVVGAGNSTLGGWSNNSDHWGLMVTGWNPEGRDLVSGSNILGVNFIREEVMPFTHNYQQWDTPNNPEHKQYIAWHGDIWISDPVEDIAPGYIDDFYARDSYTIDGTDTEIEARMDILFTNVHIKSNKFEFIDFSNNELAINYPGKNNFRLYVFNSMGRLTKSLVIEKSNFKISNKLLNKGVNFIKVQADNKTLITKKIFKI